MENLDRYYILKEFGRRVRKKRRDQDRSQENLAELCDLAPSYISCIEHGHRNVSIEVVVKIARALKCHAGELIPD